MASRVNCVELGDVSTWTQAPEAGHSDYKLIHGLLDTHLAFAKFISTSVSEVLGYQFAGLMGVRVLPAQGFWFRSAIRTDQTYADPYRVGIGIEYHRNARRLSWGEAAERDPLAVGGAFALGCFERLELGEFLDVDGYVYHIDLAHIGPIFTPEDVAALETNEQEEVLRDEADTYAKGFDECIESVQEVVSSLGIESDWEDSLNNASVLRPALLAEHFSLGSHPLSSLYGRYMTEAINTRLTAIRDWFI